MPRSIAHILGDTRKRTFGKTISWRIIATLTTMTLVYIFTREIDKSLGIGALDMVAKLIFYYLHERVWQRVAWEKNAHPLADIPVTRELNPEDREKIEQQLKDLGYID